MQPPEKGQARRTAVIGAGIVGASVALRLAQSKEARAVVFERSRPGSGTTSASFAWANANEKTPRSYFKLNLAGLDEHYRLRDELGGKAGASWLYPGGNLEWARDEEALEELDGRVERLRSWGYAAEWWRASRVNESLEPNVSFPTPATPMAFFPDEAWVDAPRLANVLVERAREEGAELRPGDSVGGIETEDGRVSALRLQGGERLPCDAVVNAAGPEADVIAAMLGRKLPLKPSGGLLVNLAVEHAPVGRLLHSPCVKLRPDGPGRVLAHHGSVDAKLESDGDTRGSLSRELLERARRVVPALEGAKVERVRAGVRSMPVDGLPCVGAVAELPGYYEAVIHSGVTLGPLLGRLLAREILTGEADALVAPFRPDRFTRAR